MKRYKITLEQIADIENCKRAIKHASKRKRNRPRVMRILERLDDYAARLRAFLLDGNAHFHDGQRAVINEGTHKKRRELAKPVFFPDQCAHWAIMQILSPCLIRTFYPYSCSCIKGRGVHYAKRNVQRFLKDVKNTKYCAQLDIKSFYASVDKDILIKLFKRKIKDARITALLEKVVYSYSGAGLPLGYYTSAPFANFYLSGADRYIKENLHIPYEVRYADDIVLYSGNKRDLHRARRALAIYIEKRRKLRLKSNWQIYKMPYLRSKAPKDYKERRRATDFVGFKFYRYKTTIRKSIFLNITRGIRKILKSGYTPPRVHAFISRMGYIKHSDSLNVRRKYIDGKINFKKIKEIAKHETRHFNVFHRAPAKFVTA